MAKQKIHADLKAALEVHIANFHAEMAAKGFNAKLTKLTIQGDPTLLGCPCGTENILDGNGNIIRQRCARC